MAAAPYRRDFALEIFHASQNPGVHNGHGGQAVRGSPKPGSVKAGFQPLSGDLASTQTSTRYCISSTQAFTSSLAPSCEHMLNSNDLLLPMPSKSSVGLTTVLGFASTSSRKCSGKYKQLAKRRFERMRPSMPTLIQLTPRSNQQTTTMLEPARSCEAEHNHDSHTKTKGPEILRNKVHTGWGWQILLWKSQRKILIQKIHHKSTLQRSRPNLLRAFADLRLRSFALICALLCVFACFCVRLRLERPCWELQSFLNDFQFSEADIGKPLIDISGAGNTATSESWMQAVKALPERAKKTTPNLSKGPPASTPSPSAPLWEGGRGKRSRLERGSRLVAFLGLWAVWVWEYLEPGRLSCRDPLPLLISFDLT